MKFYLIPIAALFILVGTACEDYLKEEPYTFYSSANFFDSEANALLALDGAFASLLNRQGFGQNYFNVLFQIENYAAGNVPLINVQNPPGVAEIPFPLTSGSGLIVASWVGLWQNINQINFVLDGVTNMSDDLIDSEVRTEIQAQARFLRGMIYFFMVRTWGDLPIRLNATSDPVAEVLPRNSITEVYNRVILPDLKFAKAHLPVNWRGGSFPDSGRPTRGSAVAYLGEVYLTMYGNPLNAGAAYLDSARAELISMVDVSDPSRAASPFLYGLEPDFQNNLLYAENSQVVKDQNSAGQEIIFAIITDGNQQAGAVYNNNGNRSAYKFYEDKFVANDYRHESIYEPHPTQPGVSRMRKFQNSNNGNGNQQRNHDMNLMMYSDVLILFAEIENELNNGPTPLALDCINALRARARNGNGNTDPGMGEVFPRAEPADVPAGLTYAEFADVAFDERILENVGEMRGWFDQIRLDRRQEVAAATGMIYEEKQKLLPISIDEILASNGVVAQNPGW